MCDCIKKIGYSKSLLCFIINKGLLIRFCTFLPRHLTEQAERSLQDAQKHLSRRESDLEISSDHIHQLEVRIADLQHTSLADQDEIRRLRNTIASLDQEKDNLAMGVDEKTERIVTLEQDLSVKVLHESMTVSLG